MELVLSKLGYWHHGEHFCHVAKAVTNTFHDTRNCSVAVILFCIEAASTIT